MAYDEKTGASRTAEMSVDHDSPVREDFGEKLAGIDVEAKNITGDIPMINHDLKDDLESKEVEIDWYKPFALKVDAPEEYSILTFRAVFVGICLGSLTVCSNVYLGLKTGITFSSNIFGAMFGYGIVKFFEKTFGNLPILGGKFGPQENCIIQSAAIGAGGLSGIFVASLPAMYQLELLSREIVDDFGKIITLTLTGSFFGIFFVTPLRKYFIIKVARELKLIFPTSTAVAVTIRNMHASVEGGIEAMQRLKALWISFTVSIVWRVASFYAVGIMFDWHIFTWFYIWSGYKTTGLMAPESWGWLIELTPAFIGSGMLVGLQTAWSMMAGSFTAYGFIGPILVHYGEAKGSPFDPDDLHYSNYINYNSLSLKTLTGVPSPRYWFLWPAVFTMIACTFAEFACQYKMIGFAFKSVWQEACAALLRVQNKRGKTSTFLQKHAVEGDMGEEDFALPKDQMKTWEWVSGLIVTLVVTFIICDIQWGMHPGYSLLASLFTIIFAFLAIQCSGQTDWVPLTAAAKATQLIMGPASIGAGSIQTRQTINLVAGTIASSGADVSCSLTGDFRTGFLLSTPPRKQWYAQAIGAIVAVFLAPGIFVLFMTAYPCIYRPDEYDSCAFTAPSVAAWKAVAQAVTQDSIHMQTSSAIFTAVVCAVAVIQTFVKHFYLTGAREKYKGYLPNWMGVSIAWLIPQTQYSTAMLTGALIAHYWLKKWPKAFETYGYATAAGMISGEGIGGVVGAILTIAGVDGVKYGSNLACPLNSC